MIFNGIDENGKTFSLDYTEGLGVWVGYEYGDPIPDIVMEWLLEGRNPLLADPWHYLTGPIDENNPFYPYGVKWYGEKEKTVLDRAIDFVYKMFMTLFDNIDEAFIVWKLKLGEQLNEWLGEDTVALLKVGAVLTYVVFGDDIANLLEGAGVFQAITEGISTAYNEDDLLKNDISLNLLLTINDIAIQLNEEYAETIKQLGNSFSNISRELFYDAQFVTTTGRNVRNLLLTGGALIGLPPEIPLAADIGNNLKMAEMIKKKLGSYVHNPGQFLKDVDEVLIRPTMELVVKNQEANLENIRRLTDTVTDTTEKLRKFNDALAKLKEDLPTELVEKIDELTNNNFDLITGVVHDTIPVINRKIDNIYQAFEDSYERTKKSVEMWSTIMAKNAGLHNKQFPTGYKQDVNNLQGGYQQVVNMTLKSMAEIERSKENE